MTKWCLYCPDDCKIENEHHHYHGKKFDNHPGKPLPRETLGLTATPFTDVDQ